MKAFAFLAQSAPVDMVENIIFLLGFIVVLILALSLIEGAWLLFLWCARRYARHVEERERRRVEATLERLRARPLDTPGAAAEFLQRGARR